MSLNNLLIIHKKAILSRWFDLIIESYPPETAQFLKQQKNRFANPVGSTIAKEIEAIFDQLAQGDTRREAVSGFLDRIIRIRAVQDFAPSAALYFIFQLKTVIREELAKAKDLDEAQIYCELQGLEESIDQLALLGFDIYVSCRQKIFEIKADEMKRLYANVLRRSEIFCEPLDEHQPG
jgi:hypothetical protein